MSTAITSHRISTSNRIRQLGLPATQQRKALETLAWVDALLSPFFAAAETKADTNKPAAIRAAIKSH